MHVFSEDVSVLYECEKQQITLRIFVFVLCIDSIFVQLASPLSVEVGNDDGRTVLTPRFPNITQLQFALVRRDDQTVGENKILNGVQWEEFLACGSDTRSRTHGANHPRKMSTKNAHDRLGLTVFWMTSSSFFFVTSSARFCDWFASRGVRSPDCRCVGDVTARPESTTNVRRNSSRTRAKAT